MKSAIKVLAVAAAVATVLTTGTGALAQKNVNYLLPAPGFLPAFAAWQLARHKGYYAAEGINVTFQTAKGGVDVAKQVGVGNAPIGGGIGDTSILVRPSGIEVRSVALLGGGSLVQLITRADGEIKMVEDLRGKRLSVMSYQDTTFYASQGILASRGLTRNDVDIQAAGPQGVWKLFAEGKVDALMGVPDWIGILRGQNISVRIFNAQDYFPSMAQAILSSDEMIKNDPELVGGLVRATLKGLADLMADPDAAAEEYVKAVPRWGKMTKAMAGTFKLYNMYTWPGQKVLGTMDESKLAALQDFYLQAGFIKKKTPVTDLYTNQFVQ